MKGYWKVWVDQHFSLILQKGRGISNHTPRAQRSCTARSCRGTLRLQVYKQYLLWGLKSINGAYLGLFGVLGERRRWNHPREEATQGKQLLMPMRLDGSGPPNLGTVHWTDEGNSWRGSHRRSWESR